MEDNVEGVTLENFSGIYKIIWSYTIFESLLFRNFGLSVRSMMDVLLFLTAIAMSVGFNICHIILFQQNIEYAMIQVAVMCHTIGLVVRIITVFIYREEIVALTSVNFRDFNCNMQRPNSSLNSLKESYVYLMKLDKFMKGNFWVFFGTFYVLPAIMSKSFVGLLEGRNGVEDFLRALPTTLPDDGVSTTNHMLSWTFHIVFGIIFISIWATLDVLCFGLTILLKKQYQILRNSLRRQYGTSPDCTDPMELKGFVQDHVKLIRMTIMHRDLLSPIVGAQMVETIFITACGTYAVAKPTADSGNQFTANFVAYSILSLMELLAFCWQSHMANQANESLGLVIYELSLKDSDVIDSGWFLPLLMSQKTIKYKALGLVEINMETFLGVLRASYSYYTLTQAKT